MRPKANEASWLHGKLYSGRELLLSLPRHGGDRGVVLDYRHVIDHLLRKPGPLSEYRYREELFLSPTYRQAYDRLGRRAGPRRGARWNICGCSNWPVKWARATWR